MQEEQQAMPVQAERRLVFAEQARWPRLSQQARHESGRKAEEEVEDDESSSKFAIGRCRIEGAFSGRGQ